MNGARKLTREQRAARLEDLQFLDETGECATGAARRLGITITALEKWLRHNDRALWQRLRDRDPQLNPERDPWKYRRNDWRVA